MYKKRIQIITIVFSNLLISQSLIAMYNDQEPEVGKTYLKYYGDTAMRCTYLGTNKNGDGKPIGHAYVSDCSNFNRQKTGFYSKERVERPEERRERTEKFRANPRVGVYFHNTGLNNPIGSQNNTKKETPEQYKARKEKNEKKAAAYKERKYVEYKERQERNTGGNNKNFNKPIKTLTYSDIITEKKKNKSENRKKNHLYGT